jgi:hypothetical protein
MVTPRPTAAEPEHPVELHGAWNVGAPPPPALVERSDEDFLAAMLSDLQGARPEEAVTVHRPTVANGALRLYQPVHRVFNLVLLEAHCATLMNPRLDPRKIESAGFVVRRVARDSQGRNVHQAWCAEKGRVAGWRNLDDATRDLDPDPARRTLPRLTADRDFDARLRGPADALAEDVTSLFVAPSEVAAATGRTLLYGVVPTTSSSRAGRPAKGPEPSASEWEAHLSLLLKSSGSLRPLWPAGTDAERRATLQRADLTDFAARSETEAAVSPVNPGAMRFILLVRQLAQEFSLLRPVNVQTRDALVSALNQLALPLVDGSNRAAGDYLAAAARFYFEETEQTSSTLPRPQSWPAVSSQAAGRLLGLLRQIAGEVELSVLAPQNSAGRFDEPGARYVVRAFIRVKRPCNCPPRLVWSAPSDEFTIVPWFESGPVAPVQVALPDPFDKDFLKAARPGVAFNVPRKLANAMNQDPKKLLEGKPGTGDLALDWICGFNIPIITICAFFVLNIFLSLLNIIFWWLPFVKICIPFPRKK